MSRDADREQIARDVAEWLANGGVIERLPLGASSFRVDPFNAHVFEADPDTLPAIATVDE